MGFHLSVEAIQHAGRRLAIAPPPAGAGLNIPELCGNAPFPLSSPLGLQTWHQTYLDNWDQFCSGPLHQAREFFDLPSAEQLRLREAWHENHVVRSESKAVEAKLSARTLGLSWDGIRGTVGPDAE
eukprot:11210803-Karenia_brevis.AAC.1